MRGFHRAWALAVGLFAPGVALAGAWTLEPGTGQAILTGAYSEATQKYTGYGSTSAIPRFAKRETTLFMEYGLMEGVTLTAQTGALDKRVGPFAGEHSRHLADSALGVRGRVWKSDYSVASIQASVIAPGAFDDDIPARVGDTDWKFDARGLFGRGFELFGQHGFADIQAGYRARFGDPADELRLDLTAGLDVAEDWFVMAQSFNTISIGEAKGVFDDYREHKVQLSGVWKYDTDLAFQAGVFSTVAGENALQEFGGVLSVWRKF